MEGEQFSLCWNNFHSNLSSGFHSLLKEEDLVDVTLAAEGKFLKAHKTVLSVCSPFFKELFRVNPCKHPIVILPDVNYGALCSLLHFMYQGEVSVGQEEIPTFMRVAEMLKVKGLTDNSNSSSPTDTNGFPNNRGFGGSDQRQNIMKRPRPVKKVIRPMQPLRPIESPKPIKSPQPQQSQTPQPQPPPLKKPHLEPSPPPHNLAAQTQQHPQQQHPQQQHQQQQQQQHQHPPQTALLPKPNLDFTDSRPPLFKPKQEPLDHDEEDASHSGEEPHMDISHMLDTTLGEQSPGQLFPNWPPPGEFGEFGPLPPPQDTNQPDLVLLKSAKGQLVLIHNGHIYTLCDKKDIRSLWVCVKKKTLNCPGHITTLSGPLLLSYSGHNHPQLHDVIKKLQVPNCSISPELRL